MDLTDIWQQHKKFIIAIAAALLLLLIGRGVLQGYFPVDERRASAKKPTARPASIRRTAKAP